MLNKILSVTVKIAMSVIKKPHTISKNQTVKGICGDIEQNYWSNSNYFFFQWPFQNLQSNPEYVFKILLQ